MLSASDRMHLVPSAAITNRSGGTPCHGGGHQ
ncbi:hypothetical protein ACWG8W_10240 [Citricoccus zhacaiensis]